MSIKYHDNLNGIQYGTDHKLTNNWNPDGEYKDNEYCEVYFRIECPAYMQGKYPCNFYDDKNRTSFYDEVRKVLTGLGWYFANDYTEPTKEKSHLYIHPQNISGEMLKKEVRQLAEAFENNQTFYLRWVDIYDTVFDITDEEYNTYLETKKDEIINLVLKNSVTKRTNKYFYICNVANFIADKIRLTRIGNNDGRNYGVGYTARYIIEVINELIKDGYLVKAGQNNNVYIRTINKTEQKQKKLYINV